MEREEPVARSSRRSRGTRQKAKGRVNRNVLFFVCVSDEESPLRSPDSGEFLPEAGLLGRGRFAAFGVDNVGLE